LDQNLGRTRSSDVAPVRRFPPFGRPRTGSAADLPGPAS